MKRGLFIIFNFFLSLYLSGQINLIPNPSFEDTFRCPSDSLVIKAKYWYNPTICGSPDYFYPTLNGNPGCIEQLNSGNWWGGGGYYNNWGYQLPHSGIGFAGSFTAQGGELIANHLLDSMRAGKKYAVSFYAVLGDSYYSQGGKGFDLIEFYFMKDSITNYDLNTCWTYFGQLHSDAGNHPGNFLTDTLNWMLVQDTFVANGVERYFVFGNIDTANTQYFNSPTPTPCYFYFDDFDVHCIDCEDTIVPPQLPDPKILVQPNLSNGNFPYVGEFPDGARLRVYNMLGQVVFEQYINPGYQTGNIFVPAAYGMYIYSFESGGKILKHGKLMKVE